MTAPPEVRERAREIVRAGIVVDDAMRLHYARTGRTNEQVATDARLVALRWLLTLIDREAPMVEKIDTEHDDDPCAEGNHCWENNLVANRWTCLRCGAECTAPWHPDDGGSV